MPETTHFAAERAKVASAGATLDGLGGYTPVQGRGEVDGHRFYFRARGAEWQFHVALTDELIFHDDLFFHEQDYGEWPVAGGRLYAAG